MREGHVAVPVMMAVAFSVGGDVDELGFAAAVVETLFETANEAFTGVEQTLKGHGARDWSVIEEDG